MKTPDQVNILVIGDIMLDKYIVGNVERISPEAPVPVVHVTEKYSTLGGCGNVVRNIVETGANVTCLSAVAPDSNGELIKQKLKEIGANRIITHSLNVTTVKERIVANSRKIQMLRVDYEERVDHDVLIVDEVSNALRDSKYDCIIISDYNKGAITEKVIHYLETIDIPIIIDPKPPNAGVYKNNIFILTPNEKEWAMMDQHRFSHVPYILVTKGKQGMTLHDFNKSYEIPAHDVQQVFNVSGAGDTVVGVLGVCTSMGISVVDSAKIANQCASYVVSQPGTTPVSKSVFNTALLINVSGKKRGG
jgi:rfaE bifunctional protein kinase chain/domain